MTTVEEAMWIADSPHAPEIVDGSCICCGTPEDLCSCEENNTRNDEGAPFGVCPHCDIGWMEESISAGSGVLYCPHCGWDPVHRMCRGSHWECAE